MLICGLRAFILQVIKTSLISAPSGGRGFAPAITYCSAMATTQYAIPYPAYMNYYTSYMASIAGQCSAGSRRDDSQAQLAQHQEVRDWPAEV